MDYEFRFQDPTDPGTVYLFEALLEAAEGASEWRGIFAFATRNGAQTLLTDPVVDAFLKTGTLELVVGIDAVTNRSTLEYLAELEREKENLTVRVFFNETSSLFHPKLSHFRYRSGRESLIVGSGNLTPNGLQENFEAYTVLKSRVRESINVSELDNFFERHQRELRSIDEEVLERAARNIIVPRPGGRRRRPGEVPPEVVEGVAEILEEEQEPVPLSNDRVLVAEVPKAGGRWHQIHFNQPIIEQYFQVEPNSSQRVYLLERKLDGSVGNQEVRPCIFSEKSNRNLKIELGARQEEDYPDDGRPIAIFRELQARSFEYMLLLPDDPGYYAMLAIIENQPSIGNGVRRVIVDMEILADAWPECPLVTAE